MKRLKLLFCLFLLVVSTSTIVNSKEDVLSPTLKIIDENVSGSAKSLIICTKKFVFFFDQNGKCVKRIPLDPQTNAKTSSNFKYVGVAKQIGEQEAEVNLYNALGEIIWKKHFNYNVMVEGVASDINRVLLSLENDSSYNIGFYDKKGDQLSFVEGKKIVSLSDNINFLICKDQYIDNNRNLYLFDKYGKSLVKYPNRNFMDPVVANNGVVCMQYLKGSILFDSKGNILNEYPHKVRLSRDGECLQYSTRDTVVFSNKKGKTVLEKYQLVKQIGNRQLINHCLSLKGDILIYGYDFNKSEAKVISLHSNGNIKYCNLKLEQFYNLFMSSYDFILDDTFLMVTDEDSSNISLFSTASF